MLGLIKELLKKLKQQLIEKIVFSNYKVYYVTDKYYNTEIK